MEAQLNNIVPWPPKDFEFPTGRERFLRDEGDP